MQELSVISINLWDVLISLANLVVLYFVMKKFLYKPVKRVLAEREEKLANQYRAADEAVASANAARQAYDEKLAHANTEADNIISEATASASRRSEKIVAEARSKADEIIRLYHSLRAPYRNKAVWLMNDSTLEAIRLLKDNNGQYIWRAGLTEGAPDTILGRPVYTSTAVPGIGAGQKVMAFGDFSYYWIGDRQGISFRRLNELYATTGQVGFLATKRVDAKLILPEAIKVMQMKSA